MILNSINGKKWISDAMDKMHAYLDRAPILVTDITGTENCRDGVFIIHEETKTKKFFPFEIDSPIKAWVHNMKVELLPLYPRIIEEVVETVPLTPMEMALYVEKGGSPDKVPHERSVLKEQRLWRLDRVQVYKDIFILSLEATRTSPDGAWIPVEEQKFHRYKYQGGCSVLYLTRYRNKEFPDFVSAGEEFFKNSIFIDELEAVK